jgi:hypothetical protein
VLRVKGANSSRLPSNDFLYLEVALKESGIEPDAETRLANFRATYEPIICGLAEYLMIPLPNWAIGEHRDNWEKDRRGKLAKRLVESVEPEPAN